MRRSFVALMFVTSLYVYPVLAKDIVVDSVITGATVYSDRASLTRSAKIEIPAGAHNLIFKGLPIHLFTDSLRSEGGSSAHVVFGALSHKSESSQDYIVPREKELNDLILVLEDQQREYEAEKQALALGRGFLENIGKQAALRENENIAEMKLDPVAWAAAADGLSSKLFENLKASLMLDVKIRDTNDKIQKIQNDLNQLRTGQKQSYSVSIPFESDAATTLNVALSYQLPNVGWRPVYDARLDVKSGTMDLVQYGAVWQRTGEDWTDVKLTLSTAQPSRGAGLPDLYPNWLSLIDMRQQQRTSMKVESFAASAPMAADQALFKGAMEENSMVAEDDSSHSVSMSSAQINADGLVAEYEIKGPATVKSDGTQSKLLIGSFETENKIQIQVKPQISTDAYLVVKSKLKGEAPILSGQVSLFRDDAYIGQAELPMLRPEGETQLAFGVDDNVTVKRNILKDERSEAGLITKDTVVEKGFSTDIQNLHKDEVDIVVLETVPVSQDERIRVEILKDKTTQGYEADADDVKGVTRWSKTMQPQEKAKILLGWTVSWPKGENVSGL